MLWKWSICFSVRSSSTAISLGLNASSIFLMAESHGKVTMLQYYPLFGMHQDGIPYFLGYLAPFLSLDVCQLLAPWMYEETHRQLSTLMEIKGD